MPSNVTQKLIDSHLVSGEMTRGSDSHTPAAGSLGILAIGVGGGFKRPFATDGSAALPRPTRVRTTQRLYTQ